MDHFATFDIDENFTRPAFFRVSVNIAGFTSVVTTICSSGVKDDQGPVVGRTYVLLHHVLNILGWSLSK